MLTQIARGLAFITFVVDLIYYCLRSFGFTKKKKNAKYTRSVYNYVGKSRLRFKKKSEISTIYGLLDIGLMGNATNRLSDNLKSHLKSRSMHEEIARLENRKS